MDWAPRSLIVAILLAPVACGDGTGGEGSGSGSTDTGNGSSFTGPTGATTTASGSDSATTGATTMGSTGLDGSTGASTGETDGGTDTGVAPPCPYEAVDGDPPFAFEQIGYGFAEPVFVIGHPAEPERLFVIQQFGRIKILAPGEMMAPADDFLDLTAQVMGGGEQGLLSLAFAPGFPDDPRVYVYYTAQPDGRSRIEEYTLDPNDPDVADPSSARVLLELYQGSATHHGGMMAFDADGQLIVSFGDGADGTSPRDPAVLHSKFIRIGVEPDGQMDDPLACQGCAQFGPFDYTIPADNPFVGDAAYAPEIFAMGFRNPWRWHYDVGTGDIYCGDVGLESFEEIDIVSAANDYGWDAMEGNNCANDPGCDANAGPNQTNGDGITAPLLDYPHDPGCAVIGGGVYRSCEVPAWQGVYFYGDYCTGEIMALRWDGQLEDLGVVVPDYLAPLGSGQNAWGDVYFSGGQFHGEIYRLAPMR
jgi:glucose/arabinose dehydrogenase